MKKLISLLLALILLLGLVACGGTTTTQPGTLDSTTVPETPDATETPEDPGTEEVLEPWDGDYENATFGDVRKYGIGSTNWDGSLPLTTNGEEITIGLRTNSKVTDYEANPYTVYLEEQKKRIRLDARGNKENVHAEFSIEEEHLAFPVRARLGEVDYHDNDPDLAERLVSILINSSNILEITTDFAMR